MTTTTQHPGPGAEPDGRGIDGFGMELLLDLSGCNPDVITSAALLKAWTVTLADAIGMTRWGEPTIAHFGEGDLYGWTVIQLITTSNINVHAVEGSNDAYINVFSCRGFDPDAATALTVEFFGATAHHARVIQRRSPGKES
ncbi:S-adenosylmethionine decarboxylase [Actinoplanes sp. NBRC 103695]|uniref:S-adenosylmethionine decarboxylase n=1 Tax=Actinoplanes sp. NBRC 103695 TaxID=3032202 RepID=UPI0024A5B2FB|nr:S-adenosylmethionine decarboxylase [Actinoplanes sp. NBRC 103695]GLY99846.1 hypothetical protein Acsp02_70990 [Actinoplanes sp. NBRC 103695]